MARLLAVLAGLCIVVGAVAYLREQRDAKPDATTGPPAVGNFRVLSASESTTLVHFGENVRSCIIARGTNVEPLVVRRTRISMHLPDGSTPQLGRDVVTCAEQFGGPPPRSSLQIRGDDVLLYLPVRCLLDENVARSDV
jgi:hypothetical protein